MDLESRLETKIQKIVRNHINRIVDDADISKTNVHVMKICRQNVFSSRLGGECIIEYCGADNQQKIFRIWIKQVEHPQKFFTELSFVYKTLEKDNLHHHITKPYCYDEDTGIVCIGLWKGASLLNKTLIHALKTPIPYAKDLPHLYFKIGKWLQNYHSAMSYQKNISIKDILHELFLALENDQYFASAEKTIIDSHLKNIQNSPIYDRELPLVRTHNDFSARNILIHDGQFGIVDWDAMVHPKLPDASVIWHDVCFFLTNIESILRFLPLVSGTRLKSLKRSFLQGYFDFNNFSHPVYLAEMLYIFTLRSFLGIESDRTLPQIYKRAFAGRYIKRLRKYLLRRNDDPLLKELSNERTDYPAVAQ